MKKYTMIIATLIVWTAFHLPMISSGQTITQLESSDEFIAPSIGQTFTATMTGHVTQLEVRPSTTMSSTLYIFDTKNTSEEHPIVVQQEIKFKIGKNKTIILDVPLQIIKGEQYCFIFKNSTNSVVRFDGKRQDVYKDGPMVAYFDESFNDFDMYFKIWETDGKILLGSND